MSRADPIPRVAEPVSPPPTLLGVVNLSPESMVEDSIVQGPAQAALREVGPFSRTRKLCAS